MLNISNRNQYKYVLSHALTQCTEFILVVVPEMKLNENGKKVLDKLKPYLKKKEKGYEWPGTIRYDDGEPVTTYNYYLNEESISILLESADNLYAWQQPNRPEDLSFIMEDGTPWLISVAHEKMSWLEDENDADGEFIEMINELYK